MGLHLIYACFILLSEIGSTIRIRSGQSKEADK